MMIYINGGPCGVQAQGASATYSPSINIEAGKAFEIDLLGFDSNKYNGGMTYRSLKRHEKSYHKNNRNKVPIHGTVRFL